jgi:hypothetical protein
MRLLKTFSFALLLGAYSSLIGLDLGSEVNLSGGYRNDTLHRKNSTKLGRPESVVDTIRITDASIWQIGTSYFFTLPPIYYRYNGFSFLKNFYLGGVAYWGAGGRRAKLHENAAILSSSIPWVGRAKLKSFHTTDLQIGLGYLFDWNCWGIGIEGGFSYHRQRIATERGKIHIFSFIFEDVPLYRHGYSAKTVWKGPWVGLELFYIRCQWKFRLGYEYHFPNYKANQYIPNTTAAELVGLADKTNSNNAHGSVVFLNAVYHFCEGWQAGLWLKSQIWNASAGRRKPRHGSFADLGFPSTTRAKGSGCWNSFSIIFDMGYYF